MSSVSFVTPLTVRLPALIASDRLQTLVVLEVRESDTRLEQVRLQSLRSDIQTLLSHQLYQGACFVSYSSHDVMIFP